MSPVPSLPAPSPLFNFFRFATILLSIGLIPSVFHYYGVFSPKALLRDDNELIRPATSTNGLMATTKNITSPTLKFDKVMQPTDSNTPPAVKRQLVVHAGPPKTGTTTIQTALELNRQLLYDSSKYQYLGKITTFHKKICPSDIPFCVDHGFLTSTKLPKVFKNVMEQLHQDGTNAFISLEGISFQIASTDNIYNSSKVMFDTFSELRNDWNLTIVLVYRHYFEWVLSLYNQIEKPTVNKPHYNEWPDLQNVTNVKESTLCSFTDWYRALREGSLVSWCNIKEARYKNQEYHPLEWTYRRFVEKYEGIEVKVYNLHQEGDLFQNFMCQAVPDVEDFCTILKKGGGMNAPQMNPSRNFQYDRLVMEAYKTGLLLSSTGNRKKKRKKLQERFPDMVSRPNFKYLCPSDAELKELLQMSLKYERTVHINHFCVLKDSKCSTEYFEKLEDEQVKSFQNYIQSHKFCHWDVGYILENDKGVQDWFKADGK